MPSTSSTLQFGTLSLPLKSADSFCVTPFSSHIEVSVRYTKATHPIFGNRMWGDFVFKIDTIEKAKQLVHQLFENGVRGSHYLNSMKIGDCQVDLIGDDYSWVGTYKGKDLKAAELLQLFQKALGLGDYPSEVVHLPNQKMALHLTIPNNSDPAIEMPKLRQKCETLFESQALTAVKDETDNKDDGTPSADVAPTQTIIGLNSSNCFFFDVTESCIQPRKEFYCSQTQEVSWIPLLVPGAEVQEPAIPQD